MLPRLLAPDRPDWRWARVADLSQYSVTQAVARLQSEDEIVQRAYKFRCSLDRGTPDDDPEFHAAHYIFHSLPNERFYIEGMLIGGADNERIIRSLPFDDQDVVQAYHDLFFAVRPYRDRPAWVASAVFDGPVYRAHHADRKGVAIRLAWMLGPELFETVTCIGTTSEAQRQHLREMIDSVLHSQVAELSLSACSRHDLPDWIGSFLTKADEARKAGGSDDYQEALGSFLDGISMSVADPTANRNLNLPAREPRAVEIEVISDG